jgi:copper chaperone
MTTFNVPDMSCGHCVSTITKAVTQALPGAQVSCNLETHQVTVKNADTQRAQQVIEQAGYKASVAS